MKMKIKKTNKDGVVRLESEGEIKEVLINEDLMHPESESVSLFFRGKSSSGIIDISPEEFEKIYFAIKDRIHLLKGFRRFNQSGAIKL
ncbi:MAG: hypothetical protein ABIH34_04405 [Nanoarchaeota archaeon]